MLAGIMTDFGAPTGPVTFGGRGEFDGMLTGPFRRPRVEGEFSGEDLRGFDTLWGDGDAHIVVENGYVRVRDGIVTAGRLGDAVRRPVLARFPAGRWRRRDQRAHPRGAPGSRLASACVRDRRIPRLGSAVGRVPAHRRIPASGRLRRDDARQSRGVRRAVANGDRVAAVRRHRRTPRRSDGGERRRHDHGGRVRRVGLDLFVQPRRPPHSAREGVQACVRARAAVRHRRVLGERQRAHSISRGTTTSSG